MSIVLVADDGRELKINAWNWGVLHHVVAKCEVFPDDEWAPKRHNGGGSFDAAQVAALADFLEEVVLPRIGPDQRMFFDATVTSEPDDGTFYRAEDELWKNYSLHHSVLVRVIAFLRETTGELAFH